MGPGWILGACCLLIGPIYLNLSLPRLGHFFLSIRRCPGVARVSPRFVTQPVARLMGPHQVSDGWMDYLPIAIAPLPPFGSICIPIEHLASGGPDYGDGESRMVVAQEMEG